MSGKEGLAQAGLNHQECMHTACMQCTWHRNAMYMVHVSLHHELCARSRTQCVCPGAAPRATGRAAVPQGCRRPCG